MSIDRDEVEIPAGRRIDFEYFEHVTGQVAERMRHAGRDENDLIGPDRVGGAGDRQGAFPAPYDIDVVGLRVAMHAAAPAAGDQAVEMQVDLFGPDAGVDQPD